MLCLQKKSATIALSAGLALSLAACADDDVVVDDNAVQEVTQDDEPVADIDDLSGVSTAVDVDASFLEALESLDVTPGVVGDATLEGSTLTFPITDGEVTYYDPDSGRDPYVEGEIEHEGSGLSLSAGGTTVELTDFVVDPGGSVLTGTVTANGEVVEESAELFFLDGRTLDPLRVDDEEKTAVLEGTTVSLTREAADLLNETFGTEALTEFFLVGTATITIALEDDAASPTPTTTTPAGTSEATPEATPEATTGTSPEPDDSPAGPDEPTPSPTS